MEKTWEKNKREKNNAFYHHKKIIHRTQEEVNFFRRTHPPIPGSQEAQAESESLFLPNAHTQLNSRHGRDQHSEATCTASGNIAQLSKKEQATFRPVFALRSFAPC